ncbi:hypothetical protein [Streptomyces sp. NPDC048436]|uniref:hypothetical protein n=1 Tax=Streptomyces sp. NPDC048436 TaxID=3365550 RepID=UPI003714756E
MKSAVSRGVVTASVVVALGLTAACSGGGGDAKGGGDGGSGGAQPSKSAATGESSAATKLEAELEKAALATGDVKKYEVAKEPEKGSEGSAGKATPPVGRVDPAECRPLSDLLTAAAPPQSKAHVSRTLTSTDVADATTTEVVLLAYGQADGDVDGDAEKTMDTLRTATKSKKCATFREGAHRYIGVRPQPAPVGGDEAVSYKLASRAGEFLARDRVSVVRSGSTLIAFRASNIFDPTARTRASDPKVAETIVDAQLAKLAEAK